MSTFFWDFIGWTIAFALIIGFITGPSIAAVLLQNYWLLLLYFPFFGFIKAIQGSKL